MRLNETDKKSRAKTNLTLAKNLIETEKPENVKKAKKILSRLKESQEAVDLLAGLVEKKIEQKDENK